MPHNRFIVTAVDCPVTGTRYETARVEEGCSTVVGRDSHEDPGLSHPRWIDVHGY